MLIFLNPAAGGGRAKDRWDKIAPKLAPRDKFQLHLLDGEEDSLQVLTDAVQRGETEIVAAGGDGTVNAVLNMLMDSQLRELLRDVTFGAIGLGSSNDFQKPVTSMVEDCPYKLDFAHAVPRDVGMLTAVVNGVGACRYFISNASIGATADANREFNEPDRLLHRLKSVSTPAAILYAALKTILRHKNVTAFIASSETGILHVGLSNLGVVKNNHFSGTMRYDSPSQLDSGMLGVHLCHGMSSRELVHVLLSLSSGRFAGIRKTRSWVSNSLSVSTTQPVNVEFDGEIITTDCVQFQVLHNALRVCP
jgi:diacylglycerol kinase (ATP)